jgi:uncharacterized protein YjbI with pentapeptide repeats
VTLPTLRTSCDERLSQNINWSRHRGAMYATVVLKATLALRDRRAALLGEPQTIRWCDLPRPSGALERADESAPVSGGGAVLVHGFLYARGAAKNEPAVATISVTGDRVSVDKHVGTERNGRIPLVWEQALLTHDNPVGNDDPALIDPRDLARTIGVGPIAPGWPTRAHLISGPVGVQSQILELPERFDPRFFNPAPRDQQCVPFQGNERILLRNLVPQMPELRTWLPSMQIASRLTINGASARTGFFLDTLSIDAEAAVVHAIWRAVLPIQPGAAEILVEATLQGQFEQPVVAVPVPEPPPSLPPVTVQLPVEPEPPKQPQRVLPTEPRELTRLEDPRREIAFRIASGELLENLDLEGADLHGLDLSERSLAGSKLDGANLRNANLRRANLWATSFVGADLGGAALDDADLESANLTRAKAQKATFARASLLRAKLVKARLDGAVLDDADLTECDATGVALLEAKLRRVKANRIKLEGALLLSADFTQGWLDFSILARCSMDEATFDSASLTGVDMTSSVADRASFSGARLARAKLVQVRFTSAVLSGADLGSTNLDRADLSNARLEEAILNRATCRGAKLVGVDLTGATIHQTDFAGADLSGARLAKVDRSNANFEGAKLDGVSE